MRYKIPENLRCSKCTLQWYWSSGNSCYYDGDYFDYFRGLDALGWDVKEWQPLVLESWANCDSRCCKTNGTFGEEFWNCADVAVGDGQVGISTLSTTSEQVSTTTTTALPWEPVGGGEGRACRGANSGDNLASYYSAHSGVASLDACKVKCASTSGCVGIEYSSGGRCEVWTRVGGIRASKAVSGFTCLRYGSLPETTTFGPVGSFEAVDGGEGRACRGANTGDNLASYYSAHSGVASLDACKVRCASTSGCVGIEYNSGGRCEVWTRVGGIRASKAVSGFTCLRYGSLPATTTFGPMGSYEPVDGGEGRACRGAHTGDNLASYYSAHLGVFSLEACKAKCASTMSCVGIEHNRGGRCEVWTREQGIAASAAVNGYTCLRYLGLSTTTTTSITTSTGTRASCSEAWGKCGGTGWNGPTCCVAGYQCETESQWYSQCRPTATLVQRARGRSRLHHFLGPSLVQDGVVIQHAAASSEL